MTTAVQLRVRPVEDVDIGAISKIDEKITGRYRPDEWERRVGYYLRRDPEASFVAEKNGKVVGFMLGEVRAGEFGLEEPTGWVEVLGVDPETRGQSVGRKLADAMMDAFRARGAKRAITLVEGDMEEIGGFFRSLGFEAASIRPFTKKL